MMPNQNPLFEVSLSAGYGRQTTLEQIRFSLRAGERLGLVGASGAGKSTLVLALLGLLPLRKGWIKGEVRLRGQDLLALPEREARTLRGREIALVPQSPMNALNSAVPLRTHFREAWRAHVPADAAGLQTRLRHLLLQMQLPPDPGFLARRPGEISVGQAQRVVLALALLHRPAVLVADEPTSSLDPVTAREVLALLRETSRQDGTALLYISHDLLSVVLLCERLAVLHGGGIAETLDVEALDQAAHPASRALLETLPAAPAALRRFDA